MVRNQDDTSFLSWTATLHPESATTSVISANALQGHRNPLEVVYHEIASDDMDDDAYHMDGLPVAVQVVAVDGIEQQQQDQDYEEGIQNRINQSHTRRGQQRTGGHTALSQDDPDIPERDDTTNTVYRPKPWRYSNTIDLALGFMFSFVAWITTVKLEVTAFVIYAIAALFHNLAERVFGRTPATLLCKSIFSVLTAVMMIVDSVLIMVSVLVTEILGAIALFCCTFFGGSRSGTEWHLFIRRTCHLTRWGFRSCLTMGWKPERIFPISESAENASLQPPPAAMSEMTRQESSHSQSNQPEYRDHIQEQLELSTQDMSTTPTTATNMSIHRQDDHTSLSTLTTATILPSELPPIAVAAEDVLVLDDDNGNDNDDDETDGYFTKNTQQVIID